MADPVDDPALASEMADLATEAAEAQGLDFSVASLEGLEVTMQATREDEEAIRRLGAYVGEVLCRNATGARWARAPQRRRPGTPGIAFGKWIADPFDRVRRAASGGTHPDDTLVNFARELVTYSADPTEETAAALGWRTKRASRRGA
jgi:hypothetical protein